MKKIVLKSIAIITFSTLLISVIPIPAQAQYVEVPYYLCEKGIEFYMKGEYLHAMQSFKKSLLVNQYGRTAQICKMYMELIQERTRGVYIEVEPIEPEVERRESVTELKRELAVQKAMVDALERKVEERPEREEVKVLPSEVSVPKEKPYKKAPRVKRRPEPIELEEVTPLKIEKVEPIEIEEIEPMVVAEKPRWEEDELARELEELKEEMQVRKLEKVSPAVKWEEVPPAKKVGEEKEVVVVIHAQLSEVDEKIEIEERIVEEEKVVPPTFVPQGRVEVPLAVTPVKEKVPIQILKDKLVLDEDIGESKVSDEIELELHNALVVEGVNITRWLNIKPESLQIRRRNRNTIEIAAKKIGPTYVHIWDEEGRWTLNIRVISPKYIRRLVEKLRRELEEVSPFKFTYSFNRNAFYTGERGKLSNIERDSLTFDQWLAIDGETPYGNFDTLAKISKLRETSDLTQFTIGLTDAKVMGQENFDIRGFDYTASFSDLTFPGESLRGVRFDKQAFNKKLNYTMFWGKEGQGKFGKLSPGLADTLDAYIYGAEFRFHPFKEFDYRLSSFFGYGDERTEDLKSKVIGAGASYRIIKNMTVSGDFAHDYENFAYTLSSHFVKPKLRLSGEFRDIDSDFQTIDGRPTRSGEIGAFVQANYTPTEWWYIGSNLDVYKDRLFPNATDSDLLNYDFSTSSDIRINPTTSARFNYQYVDEKGKLSPRVSNTASVGLTKRFPQLSALTAYLQYTYRDNENPDSPSLDYFSNSLTTGLSLRLLKGLSYYGSATTSWLTEDFTDDKTRPTTYETGLDYASQIFALPLYTTLRLNYRNEENATSSFSFISGEDSVGFFGELSYRPNPEFELFTSTNIRNYRAENTDIEDRIEAEWRMGGKVTWDTGIHWNPVGTIEGTVYRDLNDDGEQQDEEPGEKDVKIFVGDKELLTDNDGFYSVSLRGKKAKVTVDSSSIPTGMVISDAGSKELDIEDKVVRVDFRLISRSEIYGVVFEDLDGDGKYDVKEKGIPRVTLILEDGRRATTDSRGQYYFRKIVAGDHEVTVDINSIPIDYLPQVALSKKLTLFEGITYVHNVPLKRAR